MAGRFARITREALKALPIGGKVAEHGIVAERLRDGDVRYSINVMVDRQRIHRVIGTERAGVNRGAAERAIEQLRAEAREGRLRLPKGRKVAFLLSDAAERYLTRLEETDGKDLINKRRHLRHHLIPAFGTVPLDKLSELSLKQYRRSRTDGGATDATVNREMSTLLHLLNRSIEWGWLPLDRKPKLTKPREGRKKIRVLDEGQCDRLREAARSDCNDRTALFVAFGLGAAMRHGEIVRVRYADVDFATRRIWINRAKAGEREQPITTDLADAIAAQLAIDGDGAEWVFPGRKGWEGHCGDMRLPFQRAVIAAGFDPRQVTPHVMRHTAITRLVQAGVDIPTIQRISGHKTVGMVLHYTHVHGTHIDKAMDALAA